MRWRALLVVLAAALATSACSAAATGSRATASPAATATAQQGSGPPPSRAVSPSANTPTAKADSNPEADIPVTRAAVLVHAWLQRLASGDKRAVYDRLSPVSQRAIGGFAGLQARRSELREGLAAISPIPRTQYLAMRVAKGSLAVVVAGTVKREGMREYATYSFGVRDIDGALRIDALASPLGLGLAPKDRALPPGTALTATVDHDAVPLLLLVDGQTAATTVASPGRPVSVVPRLSSGRHVATVAAVAPGGYVQVESAVLTVP